MSRPDLFTYTGALRILGRYERPVFDRAGVVAGGAILAAGGGLIDPKNEAVASLRRVLDGVSARLTGLSGVDRQELVIAAHTVIAVVSVFDAYRDRLGRRFDELGVTDREKFRALGVEPANGGKEARQLAALTALGVPAPGATRGFQENLDRDLSDFFSRAREMVSGFLRGLAIDPSSALPTLDQIRDRYVDHYLRLAAEIPEFQVWSLIGEHSATRAVIEARHSLVVEALNVQSESMERFSRLLSLFAPGELPREPSHRAKLAFAAAAALHKPLLRTNPGNAPLSTRFPSVERGFVSPAYRVAVQDDTSVPSAEMWWEENTGVEEDIDTFLAAHLAGPASTRRPLLVLGHPGMGKSLLMSVLAARLPALGYPVVTVPLRRVNANDAVVRQVETALAEVLSERVDWGRLADECRDGIPVVLLDGFDELVQASGVTRSNYLEQVCDFQEREADLGRRVAVVVTSRPLVVDRVHIPLGTSVVKLEAFDDVRVGKWLDAWNEANSSRLTPTLVLHRGDLARQPLLLMMLAVYATDVENVDLDDEDLSEAALYERLIDWFVVRQARDKSWEQPSAQQVEQRVKRSRTQLGIAALAMFNRGRQYVMDAELNQDLAAVLRSGEAHPGHTFDEPLSLADRTVEEFFFIHSAKLNEHTGGRRTYEFLHATFGEYLVAELALTLLTTLHAQWERSRSNPFAEGGHPDDALLFALLSHQVFTKRKPILDFARQLFATWDLWHQVGVLDVLDDLVRSYRERPLSDRYPGYAPSPATPVSRIATYAANLVCLRIGLADRPVPLAALFPGAEEPLAVWRRTVHLWRAGLDADGWRSVLRTLALENHSGVLHLSPDGTVSGVRYIDEAKILGDHTLVGLVRAGAHFIDYAADPDARERALLGKLTEWVINTSGVAGTDRSLPYDNELLDQVLDQLDAGVGLNPAATQAFTFALSREAWRLPGERVKRAMTHLLADRPVIAPFELISIACAHPYMLDENRDVIDALVLGALTRPLFTVPCLVVAWIADREHGGRSPGLRGLVTTLEANISQSEIENPVSGYFSPETVEYFAECDANAWRFDAHLLTMLDGMSSSLLRAVPPRHFRQVVERFSRVDDHLVLGFVGRYLSARGQKEVPPDLPAALASLRSLVR
ncbi:NACHT domain-containing protein [Saccharothrix lopnurensis]|uniref:NACHT domain-containing protein n=1 Tax=Saccharothrix lopnurensis TaxID=1670621 RepID=A0ABW1P6T9_9PSEU